LGLNIPILEDSLFAALSLFQLQVGAWNGTHSEKAKHSCSSASTTSRRKKKERVFWIASVVGNKEAKLLSKVSGAWRAE
jgi:hypothetical protein